MSAADPGATPHVRPNDRAGDLPALAAQVFAGLPVAFGFADPRAPAPPLWPQERAAVLRAVPRRRQEFAAGRAAAREALAALGLPAAPLPQGDGRAPVWPAGVTGSISHSASACLAVMARQAELYALGVDVEEAEPLDPALAEDLLTRAERDWLAAQPPRARGALGKGLFCAKEAVFKCQYPLSGEMPEFLEVSLTPCADGAFHAALPPRAARALPQGLRVTIALGRSHILAGAVPAARGNEVFPADCGETVAFSGRAG